MESIAEFFGRLTNLASIVQILHHQQLDLYTRQSA
jgi:hypothetical protein